MAETKRLSEKLSEMTFYWLYKKLKMGTQYTNDELINMYLLLKLFTMEAVEGHF